MNMIMPMSPPHFLYVHYLVFKLHDYMLHFIQESSGDVGLRDVTVTSGVIVKRSNNLVLEGHQYNHGVRLMKIVYEALSRLLHDALITWLEEYRHDKLELQN